MRFLPVLFFFIAFSYAEAHQFVSHGEFTILQHSEPNDTPYAGTSTKLYFIFDRTPEGFTPEACDCVLYIAPYNQLETIESTGERFVYGTDVMNERGPNHVLTYTFPRRDVYALVVEGTPKTAGEYEPFRIIFPLRVDLEVEHKPAAEEPDVEIAPLSLRTFEGAPWVPTAGIFLIFLLGILTLKELLFKKSKYK